ncbi:MAG: creatininase family protein [Planctomycetota bacterium]|nr:creatininase family protein [Planctomycetota bacterium]MDA1142702.1 creatininase family protein [Planctomycetota bacterium]
MYSVSYDGQNKKILWQEMLRHEFMEALENDPVVIVPVGSVEQHGPHCPMDVDISAPFFMAAEVATRIDDFPVIVAPPIWSGFTHYNMGFPGTISLRLETFQNLLADIFRSIHANGFKRIISINGHGGNSAPCRAVSWQVAEENVFTLSFNWWDAVEAELCEWSATDEGVGHGGEWETAVQLHLRGHLVDKTRLAKDETGTQPFREELSFAEFAERRRDTKHDTGIMGDATVATAEKGKRIFDLVCDRLVKLVREYHQLPVRDYREFGSHCT